MAQIRTSAEARDLLEDLRRRSQVRPFLWARTAFGLSLSFPGDPPSGPFDNNGTEFKFVTLFGEDEDLFRALLTEREQRHLSEEEIAPLVKAHVERGLSLLKEEFNRVNKRGDELMLTLLRNYGVSSSARTSLLVQTKPEVGGAFALDLELGKDARSNETITHRLNGQGRAPHIAIMGKNGTGKTRLALSLLGRLKSAAGPDLGMIVFDYAKGDIAANKEFLRSIGGKAIALPNEQLAFDPLAISDQDPNTIKLAARRIRDTISSVVRLGPVQQDRCLDLLTSLYQDFRNETPSLANLVQQADLMAEQENWKPDSLTSVIREFGDFTLFKPTEGDASLLQQSTVVDIHGLPNQLRKLATFLILDRLYYEIMGLPDSPIDEEGNRKLRFVIVIDEAHHFLPCKQATLEKNGPRS